MPCNTVVNQENDVVRKCLSHVRGDEQYMKNKKSIKKKTALFKAVSDCQKTLPGGLEGRSPPNVIRIRRHVRRMRKPCLARFPCAVSRPGVPQGREGNSVQLSEKDAVGGLFRHAETALFKAVLGRATSSGLAWWGRKGSNLRPPRCQRRFIEIKT